MSDERRGAPSASKFGALVKCPSRHRLEEGIPDTTSPEAASGNLIHEAMDGKDVPLKPDELDLVRRMREEEAAIRMLVFGNGDRKLDCYREQRMWSKSKNFSGMPDLLLIHDRIGLIVDYKTGRIPVAHARDNWQLKGLAVLARHNYFLRECHVAIIQPYAGSFTHHRYSDAGLKSLMRQVSSLLRKVNSKTLLLNSGEDQCRYCKAKAICPALRQQSGDLIAASGDDVNTLAADQIVAVLDKVSSVEGFIKAVKARAKTMLESGIKLDGWRLAKGNQRRKITDTQKVFQILSDSGVPLEDILRCTSFSVAKIERLLREGGDDISASEAKILVAEALEGVLETTQSEDKLECQTGS